MSYEDPHKNSHLAPLSPKMIIKYYWAWSVVGTNHKSFLFLYWICESLIPQDFTAKKIEVIFCLRVKENLLGSKESSAINPRWSGTRTAGFIRCDYLVFYCSCHSTLSSLKIPNFCLSKMTSDGRTDGQTFWCRFSIVLDFLLVHVEFLRHQNTGHDVFFVWKWHGTDGRTDGRTDMPSYRDE